jgi:uncharacterized membrane protein YcaP (DUF421 family)
MRGLRYTIDDVMESMRESSIFDLSDVQCAVVENTGKISFYQKSDMKADEPPCDFQAVVVKDGKIDKDGLKQSCQDENWVNMILNEKRVAIKNVFLLTADKNGTYNFVEKQRK